MPMNPGEAHEFRRPVRVDERRGSALRPASAENDMRSARVLVCGDHSLYRAALSSLIERDQRFHIAGESTNDHQAIQRALQENVQMVVIDYELHAEPGRDMEALERLLDVVAPHPTLLISSTINAEACQTAMRHGISGIVLKTSAADVLMSAMDSALRGQVWLDRALLAEMFDDTQSRKAARGEQSKIDQLTPREREIVQVACTGLTNKQIANKLSISEATVRHHLGSIFAKLSVSTRSELVVYGYKNRLIDPSIAR